jgi:formylglycine-generating enzyme required for sulfatase activity
MKLSSKTFQFLILISIFIIHCGGNVKPPATEATAKTENNCSKEMEGMKCIPSGEFIRGSNKNDANEKPETKIFISEFFIDTYEVTNEDFNKCKAAGKCMNCLKEGKCDYIGPRYRTPYLGAKQPVTGISYYTAKEYCDFVGKRLPTESEWEKAARGTNGDIFPWGNEPVDCTRAIIEDEQGRKGCFPKKLTPVYLMATQNVGSRPVGRYGLYDMAGNAWEWTSDWYVPYEKCGEACLGKDPKGPCNGNETCPGFKEKVLKSGSWWWPADYARASHRRHNDPTNKSPNYHHFGFRCAKSL